MRRDEAVTGLLAAGIACGGPIAHDQRHWLVDAERRLHVRDVSPDSHLPAAVAFGLRLPIPGNAAPVACDPFRLLVLLDNADAFRLDSQHKPIWRPLTRFQQEMNMTEDNGPMLVAAGTICGGGFWCATADRRLWAWHGGARTALAPDPVPGEQRIIALDTARGLTVLLETGERLAWLNGGWGRLPGLLDSAGIVRCECVRGISLGGGKDIASGDVIDLPEGEARRLLASGHVALVPLDADAVA